MKRETVCHTKFARKKEMDEEINDTTAETLN